MNKQDIINFLLEKKGYLKEGKNRLALLLEDKGFEVTIEECAEALKEARAISLGTSSEEEFTHVPQGMKIKSIWGKPGQESYSYTVDNKEDINGFRESLIEDIKNIEVINLPETPANDSPILAEISLPDFHFGKVTGETLQEQIHLYVNSIQELVGKLAPYNVSKFVLPIGNDLMNSEGLRRTTTKGTPQEDNATWQETFRGATRAVITSIRMLLNVAPVDVIVVSGNHDYERMFYLGDVIDAYFHSTDLVTVDNGFDSRKYYKHGEVLLGFTHGDNEKMQDLPLIMATERPMDFATSKYREWHLGHLHKMMQDEYRGISVKFLPSLCASDAWHRIKGYHSDRKAQCYVWNGETGLEGYLQINK